MGCGVEQIGSAGIRGGKGKEIGGSGDGLVRVEEGIQTV